VVQTWLSNYWYDFVGNEKLVKTVLEFIDKTMRVTGMDKAGEQLVRCVNALHCTLCMQPMVLIVCSLVVDRSCRLINKKLSEKGSESKKLQFSKSPPKPIMPTSSGPVPSRVVMFDPMEVHAHRAVTATQLRTR
jgi:hypothetical protein